MTTLPADSAALLDNPASLRLDGKVGWVTGASRGLGRALAFALAGAGADVLLTARSGEALEEVADAIRARGRTVHVVAGSVADAADVAAAAAVAEREWGRIDLLVNNAGISPTFCRAEEVEESDWRDVMDVNVLGPFLCCKAAFPLLCAAGGGSIVNVSSVHGQSAHERLSAYCASKGAVEMLTRSLALEWAQNAIRVNAVAPGYLETDMTEGLLTHDRWRAKLLDRIPAGRFGTTADVAGAVVFLSSEASAYLTGTTIVADGGWTAR